VFANLFQEAYRSTESDGMVGLGDLPGGFFQSAATDISAEGSVIVGQYDTDLDGEAFHGTSAAFADDCIGGFPGIGCCQNGSSGVERSCGGHVIYA
jgi:hypothetical protein